MTSPSFVSRNSVYYFLAAYVLICGLTIHFFNGTGDSGDSVNHYLFARYAPQHPELYFNHWAKPLFVLLSSGFAQFGFTGMKVFNCLVGMIAMLLTYRTAQLLQYRNSLFVMVIMLFSPLYYSLTFSGLTEPLFALFTIWGIYALCRKHFLYAAIVISFLPYIRSEGLLIAGVFGIYFLTQRSWKMLPALLTGSVVYAIAGSFVYHDLLWVFTKIPYSTLSSVYGHGGIHHFVIQLIYVIGIPLTILFWPGCALIAYSVFRQKKLTMEGTILLAFSAFFIAHSLFWYLGIFNSMGLKRVLVGVIPLTALICLKTFNLISEDLLKGEQKWKLVLRALLVGCIILFPFTENPAAIDWQRDMMQTPDQKLAVQTADFFKGHLPSGRPIFFHYYYLCILWDKDYFDPQQCRRISPEVIKTMQSGDVLIWDNHFTPEESGLQKEALDADPTLQNQFTYKTTENNQQYIFSAYIRR